MKKSGPTKTKSQNRNGLKTKKSGPTTTQIKSSKAKDEDSEICSDDDDDDIKKSPKKEGWREFPVASSSKISTRSKDEATVKENKSKSKNKRTIRIVLQGASNQSPLEINLPETDSPCVTIRHRTCQQQPLQKVVPIRNKSTTGNCQNLQSSNFNKKLPTFICNKSAPGEGNKPSLSSTPFGCNKPVAKANYSSNSLSNWNSPASATCFKSAPSNWNSSGTTANCCKNPAGNLQINIVSVNRANPNFNPRNNDPRCQQAPICSCICSPDPKPIWEQEIVKYDPKGKWDENVEEKGSTGRVLEKKKKHNSEDEDEDEGEESYPKQKKKPKKKSDPPIGEKCGAYRCYKDPRAPFGYAYCIKKHLKPEKTPDTKPYPDHPEKFPLPHSPYCCPDFDPATLNSLSCNIPKAPPGFEIQICTDSNELQADKKSAKAQLKQDKSAQKKKKCKSMPEWYQKLPLRCQQRERKFCVNACDGNEKSGSNIKAFCQGPGPGQSGQQAWKASSSPYNSCNSRGYVASELRPKTVPVTDRKLWNRNFNSFGCQRVLLGNMALGHTEIELLNLLEGPRILY
ncbi:unnamed protein product [Allacma fusca]|uniref:Uncharacterized protein n=1 Tax=Allacma fusca TaxID=39272 RepID=A0A8J2LJU5_9HEXA|nr:unnamed protein product [Allacma fusca]